MLKKRIIFTLLYDSGNFMLSRNFNLQKVGNSSWLKKNYDFSKLSFYIDELIILDVSRKNKKKSDFFDILKNVTKKSFVPVSAGGGIESIKDAHKFLRSGADKIVVNSVVFDNPSIINEIAKEFGKQSIILSLDISKNLLKETNNYNIWTKNGSLKQKENLTEFIKKINNYNFGEIYLNSIDKDGTGFGYDLDILNLIPNNLKIPLIMAGGAGNYKHFIKALENKKIDAVATANLFNFVNDGLKIARINLLKKFNFPNWKSENIIKLEGIFKN